MINGIKPIRVPIYTNMVLGEIFTWFSVGEPIEVMMPNVFVDLAKGMPKIINEVISDIDSTKIKILVESMDSDNNDKKLRFTGVIKGESGKNGVKVCGEFDTKPLHEVTSSILDNTLKGEIIPILKAKLNLPSLKLKNDISGNLELIGQGNHNLKCMHRISFIEVKHQNFTNVTHSPCDTSCPSFRFQILKATDMIEYISVVLCDGATYNFDFEGNEYKVPSDK